MLNELEIVNAMLWINSEARVSTLSSTNPSVQDAKAVLNTVNTSVQKRGWWFNTEVIDLVSTLDNEIIIPSNTLSIDPMDTRKNYTQRGTRLYDLTNNTYKISETVKVRLVILLDINELPLVVLDYIRHKAVFEYYMGNDGDPNKTQALFSLVKEAWALLQSEDLKNKDVNIYNSPIGAELMKENLNSRYRRSTRNYK